MVTCLEERFLANCLLHDFEFFLAAAVMTGSTCAVRCYNNKSNHRASISLHRSPASGPDGKKDNVRTHTQCEFQPERHFDHFTDEFFKRAVHVARSQRSIIPLSIPTIWKKRPEKTLSARTRRKVQCVAQFSYTLVCNRYIFSSVRRKFQNFLLKIAHLLTFNI